LGRSPLPGLAWAGCREVCGRADHVDLDRLERLIQDLAEPVGGIPEVVEVAFPIEGPEDRASLWRVSFGGSQDRATEQHAVGFEDCGHVPDRDGLVRSAWIVVGCIAAGLREERASTFGFGSSRVTSVPAGGSARSMK